MSDSQNRMNKAAEEYAFEKLGASFFPDATKAEEADFVESMVCEFKAGANWRDADLKQLLGLKEDAELEDVILKMKEAANLISDMNKYLKMKDHADWFEIKNNLIFNSDKFLAPFKEK